MVKKIRLLIGLQGCDKQITGIQIQKADGPGRIQKLKEELDLIMGEVEQAEKQLEDCKKQRRQIEHDIDDLENRIIKSNMKLNNIKSNKEYQAAIKEIDELKKEKSLLEDKALEFMEEMDALEKSCKASQSRSQAEQVQFEKNQKEILKSLKALDRQLADLQQERERFIEAIDPELLKKYNVLKAHRDGLAISPVVKGVCMGCHMGIPPQKFNELIRGEELMDCPNCRRMIYWGDDERFQDIVKSET